MGPDTLIPRGFSYHFLQFGIVGLELDHHLGAVGFVALNDGRRGEMFLSRAVPASRSAADQIYDP